jgi:hypothetical protein
MQVVNCLALDHLGELGPMNQYKFEAHGPWVAGSYKTHCQGCGLVRLNNSFTEWAIRMGCNNRDHPNYETVRRNAFNESAK